MKKVLPLTALICCVIHFCFAENQLIVWEPPAGTPENRLFNVQVRNAGEQEWKNLFVYNVKVGHQHAVPKNSSMVVFDFSGVVEMKISYTRKIRSFEMRPGSYGIEAVQNGNELCFTLEQNADAPRKLVLRLNESWDEECLHILTNIPEQNAPSPDDSDVYVIRPGDSIPLQLPEGKNIYFFAPGNHSLPRGLWVEIDLGAVFNVDRIGIATGSFAKKTHPQKYIVEAKTKENESYTTLFDGTKNTKIDYFTQKFSPKRARFVRLRLLGSNVSEGYIFSNAINEFEIYETGKRENLAKGRAVAGAMTGYQKATDGNTNTPFSSKHQYGNWHSGESFFISKDNCTVYIAAGAVVKGSLLSDGENNVTVRGRGILDCSELVHEPYTLYEARTGAIWLIDGKNNCVEGVTVLDSPMWAIVMNFSEAPAVSGVNIIGCVVNSDGVHMSGSTGGVVNGMFSRTCDDGFVIYHYAPTSDIDVKNCVFWGDDARNIFLGLGNGPQAVIENIRFKNLEILNQQGVWIVEKFTGVFQLWSQSGNIIRNISFENIQIDPFRNPSKSAIFQLRTDAMDEHAKNGSFIKDISFHNIVYKGSGEQPSLLLGSSSDSAIENIRFSNYRRQDVVVTNTHSGNITQSNYVSGLHFSK